MASINVPIRIGNIFELLIHFLFFLLSITKTTKGHRDLSMTIFKEVVAQSKCNEETASIDVTSQDEFSRYVRGIFDELS